VDVVTMSMGYYHESPQDVGTDAVLHATCTALNDLGVAVVASAGNDATTRECYPAALATVPKTGGPVTSVGALNPSFSVAAFSNSGPWVTAWERGGSVVSTMPTTFDGSSNAAVSLVDPTGALRETIDPDDFTGGFGVWSGSSFAAPLVAGRVAAAMLAASESGKLPLDDPSNARQRVAAALDAVLPRPPGKPTD
jgi:hypothetical protein